MNDFFQLILFWIVVISLSLLVAFNWPTPRKKLEEENNYLRNLNDQYLRTIDQLEKNLETEKRSIDKYKKENDKKLDDLEKIVFALCKIYKIDNPNDLLK